MNGGLVMENEVKNEAEDKIFGSITGLLMVIGISVTFFVIICYVLYDFLYSYFGF
jgi:hypothetical protein